MTEIGFHGGSWLIRIPGDQTFADIAIDALKASAAARIPGRTSDIFYRLTAALEEAQMRLIPDPRLSRGGDGHDLAQHTIGGDRHVSMAHRPLENRHDDWGVKL